MSRCWSSLSRIWKPGGRPASCVMQPQQPMRDAVEGAHPHGAARHAQQLLDAMAHLGRGLVGEGDGEDVVRAPRPAR